MHTAPDLKRSLRDQALIRRAQARPEWGAQLAHHLLATPLIPEGAIIAGFWPMPGEIDIRPLLHTLHARGHPILLPETPPRGHPLIFHPWHPDTPMLRERFGTMRPAHAATPAPNPTLLLVPLLAFDAACNRLGYGGGYYDRTIVSLPGIRTIGCAFALQRVDDVPVLPHDAPLDAIATEAGIHRRQPPQTSASARGRRDSSNTD